MITYIPSGAALHTVPCLCALVEMNLADMGWLYTDKAIQMEAVEELLETKQTLMARFQSPAPLPISVWLLHHF